MAMTKCAGCRVRHLTCDARSPCNECEKSGRECVRLNVRFRNLVCPSEKVSRADYSKYEFFFDGEQTWVGTNGNLEFVAGGDSSDDASLFRELEDDILGTVEVTAGPRPALVEEPSSESVLRSTTHTPRTQAFVQDDDPPDYSAALEQLSHGSQHEVSNENEPNMPDHPLGESLQPGKALPTDADMTDSSKMQPASEMAWPLNSLEEAKLFQHFITHLAPWFDVGDSERHFGKVAPCMAATSPLLMTAILAIAALTHSRVSGHSDLYNAMTLHDKCLSMIVPMLSDSGRANDDSVLMTTTILHLYDGLESGIDLPRHLKGTSIFFPADSMYNSSPLRRAVFWLHLRQEIYNAYLHQRSVDTDLSNCTFDSENKPGSNDMCFHQTLYFAAQVTKWAFGDDTSHTRWYELRDMLDRWEGRRPASFDPIHFRTRDPRNGRFFPEICYITDEHVAAAHFFYMAKLLLTTHDPNLPRIGPRMKSAAITMQETALSYVRTLVGIAVCNTFVPARFTANLAIVICGSWFTDLQEQKALLEFMRDTSRRSGWSKQSAEGTLIEAWGWEEDEV